MKSVLRTVIKATLVLFAAFVLGGALWWNSLDLSSQRLADPRTMPGQLAFLSDGIQEKRGTILAVVTSTTTAGDAINAGYELTELARAYYVFRANGYDVEIASPQGGRAPVNIDEELTEADYAFLNDPEAQRLVNATRRLTDVDSSEYDAVYFVGGKGAMFDFGNNPEAEDLAVHIYERGGVVGAVCHGPAALVGARLSDGTPFLVDKSVAGFTNEEEIFLIPNAGEVFPFLLEDALRDQSSHYTEAQKYLDHTVVDGRLVTGQNPWSTWSVAEEMVRAMGHEPVQREATREEEAIEVLASYYEQGLEAAKNTRKALPDADKRLILLHSLIAAMEWELWRAFELQSLAH
ncbi:type 1 glutamine amidotransferase domain-containing protein [Altererythrobacter arenosus]|uniref:Type 1 glutamine amidotransferase domain-containing protein n=1 Tax=Altererythrobacter arenosus TaxID=3032592 RepID=A0ABY8FRZ0_9SPHN|nr:type 1 glutamine amidotransferase domain-containing protein [Altererythrobacter sp. CAU 1644]WFL77789.1 type 1 glutamine amidotransferase domain-containing protein [Altererythrobacter sp. CAU 1644]